MFIFHHQPRLDKEQKAFIFIINFDSPKIIVSYSFFKNSLGFDKEHVFQHAHCWKHPEREK